MMQQRWWEVSIFGVRFDGRVLEFDDRMVLGYDRNNSLDPSGKAAQAFTEHTHLLCVGWYKDE